MTGVLEFLVLLYKGTNDVRAARLRRLEDKEVPAEVDGEPRIECVHLSWGGTGRLVAVGAKELFTPSGK